MRAWNGWGNGQYAMTLPANGQAFLGERIGNGHRLGDASLESVCKKCHPAVCPVAHPLIQTDAETRVHMRVGKACLIGWRCAVVSLSTSRCRGFS